MKRKPRERAEMAEKSKTEGGAGDDKQFQVRFVTKLEQCSVADTPFTVPGESGAGESSDWTRLINAPF